MKRARRGDDDRGASLVELALIAPVMALIVMGVLDLSRAYRMQIQLENAAREGAAYAAAENPNRVDGCGDGGESIKSRTMNEDPRIGSFADFAITVWTDSEGTDDWAVELTGCSGHEGDRGDRIRVDVTATFDVLTPMVERVVGSTLEITGSASVEAQ